MDELNYKKSVMRFWTDVLCDLDHQVQGLECDLKVMVMSSGWREEKEAELKVLYPALSNADDQQFYAWQAWEAERQLNG